MKRVEFQEKITEMTKTLPETKMNAVIDFISDLIKEDEIQNFLNIQKTSNTYQEWLSSENDIYDELFKDEIK